MIGPFTPGFIADQGIANQLAELGVILLMFGVGLQFSMHELLSVRAIAIPGVIAQIVVATLLGMGLAWLLGWTLGAGLVFGLALSVASTVVVLRTPAASGACSTPSAGTSRSAGWWSKTSRWCWCWCSCRRSPRSRPAAA